LPSEPEARLVAVLSDVHGNAVALQAVLAELEVAAPDLVVFGGDLTWGPLPERTLELVHELSVPTRFVAGNAERVLLEPSEEPTPRETWMRAKHPCEALDFLAGFERTVSIDIEGLGSTFFCHGSPRSDEELVAPRTPEKRMRALAEGLRERVLVSAHTHVQFDRRTAGLRSVNAGSVGMPYEARPGAYWALLGPDVELRRTEYALDAAAAAYRATDDPLAEEMVEVLETPPDRDEAIERAEALEFSG